VDGAVRVGAAVARGLGRLRRGRALLPWSGPSLLRPRLEAGQGLRDLLLRPSLPPHRGLLLRLLQGVPRWVAGPREGRQPLEPAWGRAQVCNPGARSLLAPSIPACPAICAGPFQPPPSRCTQLNPSWGPEFSPPGPGWTGLDPSALFIGPPLRIHPQPRNSSWVGPHGSWKDALDRFQGASPWARLHHIPLSTLSDLWGWRAVMRTGSWRVLLCTKLAPRDTFLCRASS
jgi:hypothetical protein